MPSFSKDSVSKLSTCHIDLQVLFFEVIKSYDCIVVCGHRTKAAQEIAFKLGNTQLHFPFGKHNAMPSLAADVYPIPLNYLDTRSMIFFAGYVMATAEYLRQQGKITHAIRWGGDWQSDKKLIGIGFFDGGHFELVI